LPTAAGDEDVENTLDSAPVVGARPPSAGERWEERMDEGPLSVGEMNPAHASSLLHPASVSELTLSMAFSGKGAGMRLSGTRSTVSWRRATMSVLPSAAGKDTGGVDSRRMDAMVGRGPVMTPEWGIWSSTTHSCGGPVYTPSGCSALKSTPSAVRRTVKRVRRQSPR